MDEILKELSIVPMDAQLTVTVSPDGMRAELFISPPEPGGNPPDENRIRGALSEKKITAGIDEARLRQLAVSPVYNIAFPIAAGTPAVNGENAVVKTLIHTESDIRPKELPDGSVDYKDLGIIHTVVKGDVLCEKTPPTPGTPGVNVYGAALPPRPGKDAPLPAGKNTVISDDKLRLMAACDGHADLVGRKIQVLNTFTVRGNVSNATGNINFLGHVLVDGSVLTGFIVQATGNISVNGTVEGAKIIAGGNIIGKEGTNGSGQGL
ncbi:MAG: FapA family protein, partial [Oscillospiraceae bacterium]|nr:FapA family protein [Oscillospiraceae bacterium]